MQSLGLAHCGTLHLVYPLPDGVIWWVWHSYDSGFSSALIKHHTVEICKRKTNPMKRFITKNNFFPLEKITLKTYCECCKGSEALRTTGPFTWGCGYMWHFSPPKRKLLWKVSHFYHRSSLLHLCCLWHMPTSGVNWFNSINWQKNVWSSLCKC